MNRVVHFEIPASDPEKAMTFYMNVFEWKFGNAVPGEYWFADTGNDGPGINGAIMKRRDPRQPVTCNIEVDSIDATFAAVVKNGGKVVVEKVQAGAMGWYAFFSDVDGNIFGVWEKK